MPRKAKQVDLKEVIHKAKPGRNGFDPDMVNDYVTRYENCQAEIDKIMRYAREEAQPQRDDQKQIVKDAAEAGLSKREFRAVLRKRRLLKKAEESADTLSEGEQLTFEQFQHALGMLSDMPLGQAVLDKANGPEARA
jgi:hypothetical protein